MHCVPATLCIRRCISQGDRLWESAVQLGICCAAGPELLMQHVTSEQFKHCLELKLDVAVQMTHLQKSHQHHLVAVHDVGHSDCEWPACDQMLRFHCPQALLPERCKPQRRITMIPVSLIAHKCCCTLMHVGTKSQD